MVGTSLFGMNKYFFRSHDLTQTNFQECTGTCLENVIIWSAIKRWSDCIGQDKDSCHLGTLSTILQHFTHHETQWPAPACRCHFALLDVSRRRNCQILTPCHPLVPPRVTILSPSLVQTLVHYVVKHSRPPDLKSSSNISIPCAWITGPCKWTQLLDLLSKLLYWP